MTQFAIFTGPKPKFKSYESVPLIESRITEYIGNEISIEDKGCSWVLYSPNSEVLEGMCCEAMDLGWETGSIDGSELYEFLASYLPLAKSITFFYATDSKSLPLYSNIQNFLSFIEDCLTTRDGSSLEIYARYQVVV